MKEQNLLKKYLKETRISQHAFAVLLGISDAMLSYQLNGRKRFGIDVALRVSKITGLTLEEIYRK